MMENEDYENEPLNLYNNVEESFFLHDQLLDALPSVIFVIDRDEQLVYKNKKFIQIFNGQTPGDQCIKEIIDRQDWNTWDENLFILSKIDNNKSCKFNIRFNSTVTLKYCRLEGKIFKRDKHDEPLLYFFTAEDITNQFEEEHYNSVETISYEWKNFTCKSSAEKKLEIAIKDLRRSNKDLEEFAYVASHDLQEPLRKIIAFSSRLENKFNNELGDEGKIFIQKISTAADNMKHLIDNLLQISRIAQYTQPFIKTELNEVLNQSKQNLDLKISESQVQIKNHNLPVIDALPFLMVQLFSNILSNAIKFNSKDQIPVINIYTEEISGAEKKALHLPASKDYYKITFKDNGIGFSPESAKEIFKIFYRLNGKTEYPGTGIGLAICSKIIEKHNGVIWAESELGKGSIFNVLLPKTQD